MIGIILAVLSISGWLIWTYSYYQVEGDIALVRSGVGGDKVFFKGNFWAFPLLHQVQQVKLSDNRILVNCAEASSLLCKDEKRIDIALTFFVQISMNPSDILKVIHTIGAANATRKEVLYKLFRAKFEEAMKTLALSFDAEQIVHEPEKFKKELMLFLEEDMNGYQINRINIATIRSTNEIK